MKIPELRVPTDSQMDEFMALAELGQRAQVIFHDLANHFTSLNLTIRELENNLASEKKRYQEYSRRSVETRAQIEYVANLLRSHIRGTDERFVVSKIIKEIIDIFQERLTRSNISITLNLKSDACLQNKRDFIHIITNLVGNAIESLEASSNVNDRKIHITLNEQNNFIHLAVSDNGPGIQKRNVGKIFTNGFTTKKLGNGIGLAAVKERVEQTFEGKISVSSAGTNTAFKITLPKQNRKRISPPVSKKQINQILLSHERLRDHVAI